MFMNIKSSLCKDKVLVKTFFPKCIKCMLTCLLYVDIDVHSVKLGKWRSGTVSAGLTISLAS